MSTRPEFVGKIGVIFADDEPMARASVRGLLEADKDIEILAECRNGREVVDAVREFEPHVLFLDIQMPGMTGFDVIAELEEDETPVIVFATAYDQYALAAFEVSAIDYLLKPFDNDRFRAALVRAKDRVKADAAAGMGREASALLDRVRTEEDEPKEGDGPLTRITIHKKGRIDLIDVAEVDWIESADQYVQVHTGHQVHLMRQSMSWLEKQLDPRKFLRVHRSAIVALDRVSRFESASKGSARLLLHDETWVPVSRSRLASLKKMLG